MSKSRTAGVKPIAYSKEQLLRSARYSPLEKDILSAVLADGQDYSYDQAAQAMAAFLERMVIR